MKDYTYAKKILTALEEEKIVEVYCMGLWIHSDLNEVNSVADINEINNPGFYRVKPDPKLIHLSYRDIPSICWIRHERDQERHNMIIVIDPQDVYTFNGRYNYVDLFRNYEYSSDLKTWKPCKKYG